MIEAQGQIITIDGDYVWVETEIKSGCNHCSAKSGCGTGILSGILGRRRPQLRVVNSLRAKVGDAVVVAVNEGGVVTGSLLLYLLPLFMMIIAAAIGDMLSGEGWAIMLAALGLLGGFGLAKILTKGATVSQQLRPVLVRRVESVVGFR